MDRKSYIWINWNIITVKKGLQWSRSSMTALLLLSSSLFLHCIRLSYLCHFCFEPTRGKKDYKLWKGVHEGKNGHRKTEDHSSISIESSWWTSEDRDRNQPDRDDRRFLYLLFFIFINLNKLIIEIENEQSFENCTIVLLFVPIMNYHLKFYKL